MMRAVMYHYVRHYDSSVPFFRYLGVEDFERQLDYFEASFGFVSRDEFDAWVHSGSMPDRPGKVILTFDDGVADHYDPVLPILLERGLFGIFYVASGPLVSGRMLDVHRIHLLCGTVPGAELIRAARRLVTPGMVRNERVEEFRDETYVDQIDNAHVLATKRLLNYFIRPDARGGVIDALMERFDLPEDVDGFYLSKEELRALEDAGMIVGSHTVRHPVMSTLDRDGQRRELEESFKYLENTLDLPHRTYCHPYGGARSFDPTTLELLEKLDVDYAFSVDSRQVRPGDRAASRLHLPRFDCNEFPHGTVSRSPPG